MFIQRKVSDRKTETAEISEYGLLQNFNISKVMGRNVFASSFLLSLFASVADSAHVIRSLNLDET